MCRNYNVCILPLIVSTILGIVIGALFFTGVIPVGILGIPIIVGIIFAIISLILLFVVAAFGIKKETKDCVCEYGRCLALGGLITLVSGFLVLTFIASLGAGTIISALLVGIFGFALILNFLTFVGILICLIRKNCKSMNTCCNFQNDYME